MRGITIDDPIYTARKPVSADPWLSWLEGLVRLFVALENWTGMTWPGETKDDCDADELEDIVLHLLDVFSARHNLAIAIPMSSNYHGDFKCWACGSGRKTQE